MYEGTERRTESTSDELATSTIKEYHFSNNIFEVTLLSAD